MKHRKTIAPLLAALLLMSGCGKAEDSPIETTAPETTAPAVTEPAAPAPTPAANPFGEPEAVDDSYRFTYEYDVSCKCESIYTHFWQEELPAYLDRWVENGQILNRSLCGITSSEYAIIYGWILFSGEPKQELGWQTVEQEGQALYCRGIWVRHEDGGSWAAGKSWAMLPVDDLRLYEEYLPDETALPEGCANYQLSGLCSAQLYVRQLDQIFTLDDRETLERLERALSHQQDGVTGDVLPLGQSAFLNPLYLYFTDGSTRLVQTMGDGACGNNAWGPGVFNSAQSLFEFFGVPLESPGYTHNSDGSTTVSVAGVYEEASTAIRPVECVYSADDVLLSTRSLSGSEEGQEKFLYCEDGLLDRIELYVNGELWNSTQYEYNEARQLIRRSIRTSNGGGYYDEFTYDGQGRLTAILGYYADGSAKAQSSNSYYWYSEDGEQHRYSYGDDGQLTGDVPPGDGPIRRENG